MESTNHFDDLVKIMEILRRECPWDRKQTHHSIKDNLIEETYETIHAIDQNDFEELKNELGDLLLHVVFHSVMASESGHFEISDVIKNIQDKLIRRHPHVFGDESAENEQDVAENWESIKLKEGKESILDGIPDRLPALIRAARMQEKASNVGFDWPEREQIMDKVEEELGEFQQSLEDSESNSMREEFGDFLFSLVNLGRAYGLNAEDSLRLTNSKFEKRFRYIEKKLQEEKKELKKSSLEEMDRYWEEAKNQDK